MIKGKFRKIQKMPPVSGGIFGPVPTQRGRKRRKQC